MGNVTSVTDALGHVTHYEYSPGGSLISVIDADSNRTEYTYDAMGGLTAVCRHEGMETFLDSEGRLSLPEGYPRDQVRFTQYERGLSGEVETVIDPLGQKEYYAYDFSGRVSAKTDRDGYVTRYAYNPSGDMERITYADGRSVAFTYDALRQLIRIQDWLGVTCIDPDPAGRTRKVTDSRGREICYRWGSLGEREMVTYPDGEQEVRYAYDQEGRLSEKLYPDHIRTGYRYNPMGYLESLVHQKDGSILERYEYEYDLSGNRTAIRRERGVSPLVSDGIPAEAKEQVYRDNGLYRYHYDNLDRLTEVRKDGVCIRQYEYDAFGNRIRKQEEGQQTRYVYNAADQLIQEEGGRQSGRTYQYDARGNLTAVFYGTSLAYQYAYDETNRLSMAMNAEGRLARYQYNGLGHRTGIQEYALAGAIPETSFATDPIPDVNPAREVDYLLDLTRQYHNLLARTERDERGESVQSYIWDTNAVFLKEEKASHIYLQDELGSPVRLVQSGGKRQALYGYDEFGNDRYGNQGEMQPFGYTGYQRDQVAGSYFAQAREYLPEVGRFISEDINKGNVTALGSLNYYNYCLGNPLIFVDKNGRSPVPSQLDVQRIMWEYYLNQYREALNDVKNEWDSKVDSLVEYVKDEASFAMDSVTEFVDSATNTGKKTWNGLMDGGKTFYKNDLELVKKITGAETINFSACGNAACMIAVSGSFGITVDSQGEIAFQYAGNVGGGLPSLGGGVGLMLTDAPAYSDLEGWAEMVGGSVSPGMSFGYDKIIMPNGYMGSTYSVGPELRLPFDIFFEEHGEIGYTKTWIHLNVYDFLDSMKFKDVDECLQER